MHVKQLVHRINVNDLFGRYTYAIDLANGSSADMGILYGDNGSGKTTLLRALFHLLSTADNRGHRSALARTPCKMLTVHFADGSCVGLDRDAPTVGPYDLFIQPSNTDELRGHVGVTAQGTVSNQSMTPEADAVVAQLRSLRLRVLFLDDNRALHADAYRPPGRSRLSDWMPLTRASDSSPPADVDGREAALEEAVHRCDNWLRTTLIRGSRKGDIATAQMYAHIVANLSAGGIPAAPGPDARESLTRELESISQRSGEFFRYHFVSQVDVKPLIAAVRAAQMESLPFVHQAVRSFIDGQTARLNALDELRRLVERVEHILNEEFLRDKRVRFDIGSGIEITTIEGQPLSVAQLSSGEKQLLLLVFSAMAARDGASLFIVDEPELSLNVKWQRLLVNRLAELIQGAQAQFLFATHSMELLAQHMSRVRPLQNLRTSPPTRPVEAAGGDDDAT